MSDEITGSVSTEADSLSQPDAHERFATLVIVSMNTLHWVRFAYLEMQDSGLLTLRRLTTSMAINFSDDQLINMPDPVLATCTMVENEMLSTASAREHLERLEKVDSQQGAVLAAIHVCKKLEGMRKLLHAVFRMVETLWQEYSSITGDVLKVRVRAVVILLILTVVDAHADAKARACHSPRELCHNAGNFAAEDPSTNRH